VRDDVTYLCSSSKTRCFVVRFLFKGLKCSIQCFHPRRGWRETTS